MLLLVAREDAFATVVARVNGCIFVRFRLVVLAQSLTGTELSWNTMQLSAFECLASIAAFGCTAA
jgi:hypothetical protein